jgi:acetyl esterase/lipase
MRINKHIVRAGLRASRPLFASHRISVDGKRALFEAFTAAARAPKGTRFERITIAGVPVERVLPPTGSADGHLIYLHGGAYALGSAKGYRGLVAHLAAAAGMTALIPDYSRAPEARYPVALEEMAAMYSQLLDDGLDPRSTVIAGDSAGGGLTLALAMALRDRGIPAPAALGLICPWANLAIDIDRLRPTLRDPLILPSMTAEWAPQYVGTADPMTPGISPVYGHMSDLPPIIIQTAGDDPIRGDSRDIATAVAALGTGTVDHRVFDSLWHVFHLQVSVLAEAREAIADLGAKLRTHARPSSAADTAKVAVK